MHILNKQILNCNKYDMNTSSIYYFWFWSSLIILCKSASSFCFFFKSASILSFSLLRAAASCPGILYVSVKAAICYTSFNSWICGSVESQERNCTYIWIYILVTKVEMFLWILKPYDNLDPLWQHEIIIYCNKPWFVFYFAQKLLSWN